MSITVTCDNGHHLRAPDSRAGTTGRCPACGANVTIPKLSKAPTESSIMRILGVGEELRRNMAEYDADQDAREEEERRRREFGDMSLPPLKKTKKVCPQCDWEIDQGFKICPHCRFYFMD